MTEGFLDQAEECGHWVGDERQVYIEKERLETISTSPTMYFPGVTSRRLIGKCACQATVQPWAVVTAQLSAAYWRPDLHMHEQMRCLCRICFGFHHICFGPLL